LPLAIPPTQKGRETNWFTDDLEETGNGKNQSKITDGAKHNNAFALEDHTKALHS
jgi:hypothetical protein